MELETQRWSLFGAGRVQSITSIPFFKVHFNIILPPTSGSRCGLFRSSLPVRILYELFLYARYMPR
jgi:hypothetical protein